MNEVEFVAPTIHIHILLDISTSMCSRWSQTISGLNEYIDSLRAQEQNKYKVTLTKFGIEREVTDIYSDVELDSIAKFDGKKFYPDGSGTALWGALGIALKKIDTTEPVLFVTITDGEENSSQTYTSESVNKLIEEKTKLGNYTFAYMGVDKAAWGQEAKVTAFAGSNRNMTAQAFVANATAGTLFGRDRIGHTTPDGSISYESGLSALTSNYAHTITRNMQSGGNASVHNFFDEEALEAAVQAGTVTVPTTMVAEDEEDGK